MRKTEGKMSRAEIATFAAGDMFGGGAQLIISFYYLIFLTDVVKIRPILAGTVILVSKIWDAVSDPLMGFITDNTRTRWGRRKPYFLVGFFSIIASFFLLWYPFSHHNEIVKFAYVLFAYILYSTVSTMVMIPYAAMSSEITTDYNERNVVNGTRLLFSQISSLLCAVLPIEIVKLAGDERAGYMAMALSFGILFSIPFILIFFFTKERVALHTEKIPFNLSTLIAPFKVRTFRILITIYLFAFLSMDVVSTVFAYYMNYYLKRPGELNYVLGAMLITQISMIPFVIKLSNAIGKAKTFMVSTLIWGCGIIFIALLQPNWPQWTIYANAVLMGMGIIGCIVTPWTMYPDVTDVGELAFGRRNAGSFGGIMTFMRKFSSAVGIFIVSFILEASGYLEPQVQVISGNAKKVMMEQPQSVITALKIIVAAFPFVLLFITFNMAKRYPLDKEIHEKLNKYLEFKRGILKENPLPENEVEEVKKILI
jgi:sugar (glycoside-pentoside-hexuronide) transporter